ncbi:unnamed protein product [Didymodactylos carnosus]|uniref:Uncharacterized protein n=1 Tax=Didymodactylos carnosus TaxID=1234261 RepID=A0A814Z1L6_9BILA|nr:unnamed protein product [Didymodactylos carnosus]CAF3998371.1 unnamed protein product [Didymodactylos carnosus]
MHSFQWCGLQVQRYFYLGFPKISYGEVYLALSYLPTAERLTISALKLRWFFKVDKTERTDALLTFTFFHDGRRFYQQKLDPVQILDDVKDKECEMKTIVTSSVPKDDIRNINLHIGFNIYLSISKESINCGSIVLGEKTRFEVDWTRMIDQPRQVHNAWYPLYG